MNRNLKTCLIGACGVVASTALVAGCAQLSSVRSDPHADALAMMKDSFQSKGPAKVEDVLNPDDAQRICSMAAGSPSKDEAAKVEKAEMASIKTPSNGNYLGDWKRGEIVAQNGRGMQFSDPVGGENGGNCYACHQLSPKEISYGNLGPSLLAYGKVRGSSDAIKQYTWNKVYDAQAYNACSNMPRFGHNKVLTEQQIKDVVALLLDPKSPVNQ